jgi:nucleotide-binding universal stress UspA family protein
MSTSAIAAIAFRDILIPFDFSGSALSALEYAQAIARQYNSRLLLIHVAERNLPFNPGTEQIEEGAPSITERVEDVASTLQNQGFAAESLNQIGSVSEQVRPLADSRHVDLVLTGTRAGQGLDRAIFGSNAEKLVRSIDCPVMIIGPKCAKASQNWTPLRILAATRLYPQRAKVAIYAARLAKITHAQWKLMHVAHSGQVYEREVWLDYLEAVAAIAPEILIGEHEQKIVLSERHASHEILDAANSWHADLIVMGASYDSMGITHFRRGALGEVLAKASCPVLTVPH